MIQKMRINFKFYGEAAHVYNQDPEWNIIAINYRTNRALDATREN